MFRRFHRPVTHAASLWILVGMAAGMFVATMAYVSLLAGIRDGVTKVFPPKSGSLAQEQLPSLFGKVLSIDGVGMSVDSKQPFTRILVESDTSFTTVGGTATTLAELRPGAVVTATGKDAGGGVLAAAAVVVLEQGSGEARPTALLGAPTDWSDWWARLPAFIGWGDGSSDAVAAVRASVPLVPEISVELYDGSGRLTERLVLDVPGYERIKSGNPFLTPELVEKGLIARGIVAGPGLPIVSVDEGHVFQPPSGDGVVVQPPSPRHGLGLMLMQGTKRIEAVPVSAITFATAFPESVIVPEYRVSPDGRWLLAVLIAQGHEGPMRSIHLIDLKKLGIE